MRFTQTRVENGSVVGYPCSGPITSPFGATDIAAHAQGHSGVDIGVPEGTPLLAPCDARVLDVFQIGVGADDWEQVFGNSVIIGDGEHVSLFGHLSRITVREGQQLAAGSLMGYSGNTGMSTGPHLHWGMAPASNRYHARAGGLLDPLSFIAEGAPMSEIEIHLVKVGGSGLAGGEVFQRDGYTVRVYDLGALGKFEVQAKEAGK